MAYKLFLAAFFLLLPFNLSSANDSRIWKFDSEEDLFGWSNKGATFSFLKKKGIVRIDPGTTERVLFSPPELGILADKTYFLKIRMRSLDSGGTQGFVLFMPRGAQGFLNAPFLRFEIKPDGFRDYTLDFKGFFPPQTVIDRFLIAFTGASTLEVDYINMYNPSLIESFRFKLKQGIQGEEIIRGTTINFVTTPIVYGFPLPASLYLFGIVIAIVIFLFRRKFTRDGITRAIIISFILIGFIFALRMDYNWLRMFKKDIEAFSGKNVKETIAIVEGNPLYDFISIAKSMIPKDAKVKMIATTPDSYYALKGKYYLLPIRTSDNGEYVVVYNDNTVTFDASTRSLNKNGVKVAAPVELIYNHGNYGFIYRVVKGGSI